jgi:hypothetical protein
VYNKIDKYIYIYIYIYYEFSVLHIFSLVLQPWMSAYIRKTDGETLVWPHDVESFQGSTFCLFVMVQPWNIGACWIDQVFVTELSVVIFFCSCSRFEYKNDTPHTWNMTRHIFWRHWRMTSKVRKRTSRDTKNEYKRGKFI